MEQNGSSNQVLVMISGSEEGSNVRKEDTDFMHFENSQSGSCSFSNYIPVDPSVGKLDNVKNRRQMHSVTSFSPLEITKLSPTSAIKSPDESVTHRRSAKMSMFSRPKSRLVEPSYPSSWNMDEGNNFGVPTSSPNNVSAATTHKSNAKTTPVTPRTPLMGSLRGDYNDEDEDEDVDVYKSGSLHFEGKEGKEFNVFGLIEWVVFLCLMAVLITSLTIPKLRNTDIWSLELWKWCVFVLVIFCGRLFIEWFIDLLVLAFEKNFLYKRKVLYFVYSLKKSARVLIWLFLIFLAWVGLINHGVERSRQTRKILRHITRFLGSSLIGGAMWVVKTFLIKLLASYFHKQRFFDRIQEAIFHQYVLQTLSGPPLIEDAYRVGGSSRASGHMCFKSMKKGKQQEEVIDVVKLQKMKREKVSAWTMGGLIKVIRGSGLSILPDSLGRDGDDSEGVEQQMKMITDEWEAKVAAYRVFKHVAKPGHNYIDEEDLLRFVSMKEVDDVLPLFEGALEKGRINKSSFCNWVVNVYQERKFLTHSLNDSRTAIDELHKVVSGIVLVIIIIVWLLLMEFATAKVLLFISSQLLLLVFMFGNTVKTTFEAIIFIFVMHPFDVGDRCVIEGVQMVVEEMNILTTIFLRSDNQKIYYPNSVLATKTISNFNRSPKMSDSVEFAIDCCTSAETIAALRAKIKMYLESKPENWRPEHSVQIKEIENLNKMNMACRMALNVTHTMNFQNYGETNNRRSELLFELKRIFEGLGIKYHLLPQQVHTR